VHLFSTPANVLPRQERASDCVQARKADGRLNSDIKKIDIGTGHGPKPTFPFCGPYRGLTLFDCSC